MVGSTTICTMVVSIFNIFILSIHLKKKIENIQECYELVKFMKQSLWAKPLPLKRMNVSWRFHDCVPMDVTPVHWNKLRESVFYRKHKWEKHTSKIYITKRVECVRAGWNVFPYILKIEYVNMFIRTGRQNKMEICARREEEWKHHSPTPSRN